MSGRIRLAIVGPGFWATYAHVPVFNALADKVEVVAVCGRTRAKAEQLATQIASKPTVVDDYDALLARNDIDAVDLLLPIDAMESAVQRALAAGKHVLSEKPIAGDRLAAQRLLDLHARHSDRVWMVAEDWRYLDAFQKTAELIRNGAIGRPLTFNMSSYLGVKQLKFLEPICTPWRLSPSFAGGFLLDGGVHRIAALRAIFGEVSDVRATTAQLCPEIQPVDTVCASLRFKAGVVGQYLDSYGVDAPWSFSLDVVGERGAIRTTVEQVTLTGAETGSWTFVNDGVKQELTAFVDAVREGKHHRNTPRQAMDDLLVIEALLESAETGRSATPKSAG